MLRRTSSWTAVVALGSTLGCGNMVETVLEAPRDAGSNADSQGTGNPFAVPEAGADMGSDSPSILVDAASTPCSSGLQSGSPWPMYRSCQDHRARGVSTGPGMPTIKWVLAPEPDAQAPGCCPAPSVIAADGTIYLADFSGTLEAVHPNGNGWWSFLAISPYDNRFLLVNGSSAIAADGSILSPGPWGLFAATPGGQLMWLFWPAPGVTSSIAFTPVAIADDGTIYVGMTMGGDGTLYALHPDGTFKWLASLGTQRALAPAIAPDGTIYAAGAGIHAFAPDGTEKWSFASGGLAYGGIAPSIADDGTVYYYSVGKLYALLPDGSEKWEFAIMPTGPVALGADGTIYAGSAAEVDAINPDGTSKWTFTPSNGGPSMLNADTPVVGGDGTVYWGTSLGLFAIHPDGTEAWLLPGPTQSPSIGADGTLYAGGDLGFYAIGP